MHKNGRDKKKYCCKQKLLHLGEDWDGIYLTYFFVLYVILGTRTGFLILRKLQFANLPHFEVKVYSNK